MIDLADIKENLSDVLTDYFNNEKFDLKPGSLFVVGCSLLSAIKTTITICRCGYAKCNRIGVSDRKSIFN